MTTSSSFILGKARESLGLRWDVRLLKAWQVNLQGESKTWDIKIPFTCQKEAGEDKVRVNSFCSKRAVSALPGGMWGEGGSHPCTQLCFLTKSTGRRENIATLAILVKYTSK